MEAHRSVRRALGMASRTDGAAMRHRTHVVACAPRTADATAGTTVLRANALQHPQCGLELG